jgi:hypothetical protein
MKRVLIAVMCLAAAGGLVYAAFSERWLQNHAPTNRVTFSLLSSKRCVVDATTNATTCERKSHSELMNELANQPKEGASRAFATAGQGTLGLSILSALMLLICGWYLVGKKRTSGPNGPQHLALIALMLNLIGATVFIKLKPGGATGVGVGPGFWVFGIACVLGIFAAQFASKLVKPVEQDPLL